MFAVIKTGGKQYRVAENDIIQVEKLAADAGASVTLDEVLMVEDGGKVSVGAPFLSGATVTAEVVEQARGPKIIVFKKRSEEHTSELQSLMRISYAVFCLQKKKQYDVNHNRNQS